MLEPGLAARREDAYASRSARLQTVLLAITALGTVCNNVLNVPLAGITSDLRVPLAQGVLVVGAFVLVFAAMLPLTGWLGDRFGRRRVLAAALVVMLAGLLGAAVAPDLWVLVGCRAVQGLACAAFPPSVMSTLSERYGPARRARVMSAWAASNGVGQAIGPPLGGLLSGTLGWRSIFVVLAAVTASLLVATLWVVPESEVRAPPLHQAGATTLTAGLLLIMTAVMAVPQDAVPAAADIGLAVTGAVCLAAFATLSARHQRPLIRPRLIVEARFLRSAVAAFTQMFCLSAVLVAVPLYIVGTLRHGVQLTGVLVFALPATMAGAAPAVGRLCDWVNPRWVLRTGLLVLALGSTVLGVVTAHRASLGILVAALIAVGAGVALVQTPSASGATRSPAGAAGAALGLFNMLRFAGAAVGAAWVALTYPRSAFLLLFGACAVVVVVGFMLSFVRPDPAPARVATVPVSGA